MRLIPLDQNSLPSWAGFLPEEIFVELMRENSHMHAVGVEFLEEPQGAIAWEENEREWVLQSIYIHPEHRHLRLGSELLAYLSEEMKKKNCEQLAVSYEQEGERVTLTPFLCRCGFMMETMAVPLGVTTLEDAIASLQEHHAFKKKGRVMAFDQLSKRERYLCNEWIIQEIGERIGSYLQEQPSSFVLLKDDEIAGMILLSEQQKTIRLDYCWIRPDSTSSFLPMLAVAADHLYTHYPADTRIEMILSTDQAERLYERLLGEEKEQIILCKGYFSPVSREILISF